jgi:hypothetical protein
MDKPIQRSHTTEALARLGESTQALWKWGGASLSFLVPFVVYVRTLAPTVYGLDSAELTTGAYCLGLVHVPGYPLYLLIGHLFTRLPIGNIGYRMNLMSAFFGALAIALLYLVLYKLCRRPLAALSAVLLLAFSFFVWSPAVMAEVYTLHLFMMAALILTVLVWHEQRRPRWLYLLALLLGLSLGNHLATVLLLPGLLYLILVTDHKQILRPRRLVASVLLLALGLSVYLYLPLRYAAQPPDVGAMQIQIASWQDLLDIVSGRVFWGLFFAYDWREIPGQAADYLYCLWGNFLGVGLLVGALGGIALAWTRRHLAASLALIFLANALFYIGYGAGDKRIMFGPTYAVWAIWIGLGYDWFLDKIDSYTTTSGAWLGRTVVPCLFAGLALAALLVNYRYADLSDDRRVYERAAQIMDTVEPGAYVLATTWFEVAPLEYLHVVEQRRLDVTVLQWTEVPIPELRSLITAEGDTHPFYTTDVVNWLAERYELAYLEDCDCYRIR